MVSVIMGLSTGGRGFACEKRMGKPGARRVQCGWFGPGTVSAMALTIRQVVALPDLGLRVLTPNSDLSRVVRWVATSELSDPGPWLDGDELLLTTGMRLRDDPDSCAAYAEAVMASGAAALGFGIGLTFDSVPHALLEAGQRIGLPIIEVPTPTPFVAVSKAVSRSLAAEEYEAAERSFGTQRSLIRAALKEGGDVNVVSLLARHVNGFAVCVDAAGGVRAASPPGAARRIGEWRAELERLRPQGVRASSVISNADEHVAIVPLGVKGGGDGFLILGASSALQANDVAVMNLAVSLLSWGLVRDAGRGSAWHRLAIDAIRREGSAQVPMAELGLGSLEHGSARIVLAIAAESADAGTVSHAGDHAGELAAAINALPSSIATALGDGQVLAFIPESVVARPDARKLLEEAGRAVVSGPVDLDDVPAVEATIVRARRTALSRPGLTRLDDASAIGLAGLVDPGTARAWAHEYLRGLRESSEGPELLVTLRAWLASHGQVDATGSSLGVHRHTVRHRLRRAEALLGRGLDDPQVRADLWFALGQVDP
ncbi:MAG: hypothetical protein F2793_05990 [Actinobacteria bacterium]|nr:hypothetical protein [Actinomycetota bacterium]